ncbi:hypothetical protein NB713_003866 [Xanthomonas sacchari]|nr:hypothetical protein [Xanthomonas sacchari]
MPHGRGHVEDAYPQFQTPAHSLAFAARGAVFRIARLAEHSQFGAILWRPIAALARLLQARARLLLSQRALLHRRLQHRLREALGQRRAQVLAA